MLIDILTLFPGMFNFIFNESIIKRAINSKKVRINVHNIRDYTKDKHKKVDSKPFGGGPGMVMEVGPVYEALKDVKKTRNNAKVILMSPQGRLLTQKKALKLSKQNSLILISGHYEGTDERIQKFIDCEISIGDYILTGGELPSMVLIDTVVRLIPGVLGHSESANDETFSEGLLEYPQYARPAVYNGMKVPEVLLSGNHKLIKQWRRKMSVLRTMEKRPDLINHIKQLELEVSNAKS